MKLEEKPAGVAKDRTDLVPAPERSCLGLAILTKWLKFSKLLVSQGRRVDIQV